MNLYDQLQALLVIPDAYTKWKSYREEVTNYLITHTYGDRNIAIFGAGQCNDIDLKMLSAYFEKIYLLDKDEAAMTAGLKQYGLIDHPGIEMKIVDFTGLNDDDYRMYAERLVSAVRREGRNTDMIMLSRMAGELVDELSQKMQGAASAFGPFDNAAAIGVHSQLISMMEWIWTVILQTLGKEETSVREKISRLNEQCTSQFNEALLKSVRHHCIMGNEERRTGRIGGIEGAAQGMADLAKCRERGELLLLDETSLIWPFNETEAKIYQMKFQTFKTSR